MFFFELDSFIFFSLWYKWFIGWEYYKELIEDDDEGGYVMVKFVCIKFV